VTHPEYDAHGKSPAELLAVLINTPLADARAEAAWELRKVLRAALQPRIDETLSEMTAAYLKEFEE
jgi:hypothetical protein